MEPTNTITDEQYRMQARSQYGLEGCIEIDDTALVSRGDDPGAYVQAWVWVDDLNVRGITHESD